ncbi:MAG TPA: sortase [Aggregatilineales bacterium]|nr:sortase [Anaerolineales bacterium]HRE48328.1 sortase [Aggregatilineales bacterium]
MQKRFRILIALCGLALALFPTLPISGQTGKKTPEFRLLIPVIQVDVPIITARRTRTSWSVARLGTKYAGHLEGMRLPGKGGNIGIAAHVELSATKPGPFIDLDQLVVGDVIIVRYGDVDHVYEVSSTFTVKPTDIEFVAATPYEVLTLITCESDGSGTARGRYALRRIVRALPQGSQPE